MIIYIKIAEELQRRHHDLHEMEHQAQNIDGRTERESERSNASHWAVFGNGIPMVDRRKQPANGRNAKALKALWTYSRSAIQ